MKSRRRENYRVFGGAAILVGGLLLAGKIGGDFYTATVQKKWERESLPQLRITMRNGEQIVLALRQFEKEKGHAPRTLEELIPKYIAFLPTAEPISIDPWIYSTPDPLDRTGYAKAYGERWSLSLRVHNDFCPRHRFGFSDWLVFHPSGNYPRSAYGGISERVDAWAYYHE
jgi:hypothetical protein